MFKNFELKHQGRVVEATVVQQLNQANGTHMLKSIREIREGK